MTDTLKQRIARYMVQKLQANTETLARHIDEPDGQDLLTLMQLALAVIKNIHDDYSKHVNALASLREWLDDLVFDEQEREQGRAEFRKTLQEGDRQNDKN